MATVAQELTTDPPSGQEMDVRLSALRTTLDTIERSIRKYEDILKDCQMQEEEAHQVETSPEEPDEDTTDMEMVDDEGHGNPEPSDPRKEADVDVLPPPFKDVGPTPPVPSGDVVSPEEDTLLMQPASQSEDPVAGSHSPRSGYGLGGNGWTEHRLPKPA